METALKVACKIMQVSETSLKFPHEKDNEIRRIQKNAYNLAYIISWKENAMSQTHRLKYSMLQHSKRVKIDRLINRLKTVVNNLEILQTSIKWD